MYYRDIISGKYYRLPEGYVVRAFRHGQCIELREHSSAGCAASRRWLAHPEGRIRSTRGSGQEYNLSELQPCDSSTEVAMLNQLEASRLDLESAALHGVKAISAETLAHYPSEAGAAARWRESPDPTPWGRSALLDLLRVLQALNEIAIQKNLAQVQIQIERAQEAGYDLWAMLLQPRPPVAS